MIGQIKEFRLAADEWLHLQVKPGGDAWLLTAISGGAVQEDLVDHLFLDSLAMGPVTLGNCDFLVCLANADGCQEAEDCNQRRLGESCDDTPFATRCDGAFLELCRRIGEQYRWVKVQGGCGQSQPLPPPSELSACRSEPASSG